MVTTEDYRTATRRLWMQDRFSPQSGLLTRLDSLPVDERVCVWTADETDEHKLRDAIGYGESAIAFEEAGVVRQPAEPGSPTDVGKIVIGCCGYALIP